MHKLAEPKTQDQSTQTDLTSQDYEQEKNEVQELREQIRTLIPKKY